MNINALRRIIRDESPSRLDVGEVIGADVRGSRTIAVRLSGGRTNTRCYTCLDDLMPGDEVLVARLAAKDKIIVLGKILNQYESAHSRRAVIAPPANVVVLGIPGAIVVSWDSYPGATDVCWQVEYNSSAAEDGSEVSAMTSYGTYYFRHLVDSDADVGAPETWYFRVRALRWLSDNNMMYSGWSEWAIGTSVTWDGRYRTETELASVANAQGASMIGVEDSAGHFIGTDVEAALVELAVAGGAHDLLSATHTDTVAAAAAQGYIVRGNATPKWERHDASTNHFILAGDGADVTSKAFDWDDMAAGVGADMVHDHSAAGEGGEISPASLGSYVQGSIIRGGAADWEAHDAKTDGAALTGDGTDILSTLTPTWKGLHTFDAGLVAGTGQSINPTDVTGQDLGDAIHRWDLHATGINLTDAAGWIGNSAAVARLHFDSSAATDYAYFSGCNLGLGTCTAPLTTLEMVGTGYIRVTRSNGSTIFAGINTEASGPTKGAGFYLTSNDGAASASGDRLGHFVFNGMVDATTEGSAAAILGYADANFGAGSSPGRLEFQTTPAGSVITATRLTVNSVGDITVASGGDIDPADASGQDLGDATHRWDVYAQTAIFGGATGANIVTVPNDLADAFHLSDAGGAEYLRIISTDAGPALALVVNEGNADIDFRVEASGVTDALEVLGSSGQITLGALGAGIVKSTAGGVLSSTTHDHSSAAEGGATLGLTAITGAGVTVPDGWYLGQAAGPKVTFDDTNNDLEITQASLKVDFNNAVAFLVEQSGVHNNTLVVDTANGSVAINTGIHAAPAIVKFSIGADVNSDAVGTIVNTNMGTSVTAGWSFGTGAAGGCQLLQTGANYNNAAAYGTDALAAIFINRDNGKMIFRTNGYTAAADRMVISAAGVIKIPNLAGAGTRNVSADLNGNLIIA